MGRKKREIKRIEDKSCMQVAFCKRRKGLIKKAKELSILCDAEVALLVFSNRGRLHDFSSTNSVPGTIQRFEEHHKPEEISAEVQDTQQSKYSSFMTTGEVLQTIERQVEETDVDCLSVTDLVHLENQLETAIIRIRSRKTHMMLEFVRDLHEKEKMLRKENKVLEEIAAKVKKMANLAPFQQKVTLNLL